MISKKRRKSVKLDKTEYEMLASFRTALRQFFSFSKEAAEAVGLEPQQYQALLVIEGYPGRAVVTISELAQRLFIKHNSAVGLVNRLEAEGLVTRGPAPDDRRKVSVRLTANGTRVFEKLAAAHRSELRRIGPDLSRFIEHFVKQPAEFATGRPRRVRR